MENLFRKQNLYKVTNFLNVLTQTKDADCMIQNIQPRRQQQPGVQFQSLKLKFKSDFRIPYDLKPLSTD